MSPSSFWSWMCLGSRCQQVSHSELSPGQVLDLPSYKSASQRQALFYILYITPEPKQHFVSKRIYRIGFALIERGSQQGIEISWLRPHKGGWHDGPQKAIGVINKRRFWVTKLSALQIAAAIQWQWVRHQSLIDVLNKCLFEQFKVHRYVYCTIHIIHNYARKS